MKTMSYLLLLACFFLPYSVYAEDKITEESVLEMLKQIETAVSERDVENLVVHFVDDAEIVIDMPEDLGGKMEMTLEDYKEMMAMGWAMYAQYTFEVKDIEITMHPDGLGATVTDTTIENAVFGDQIINAETAETVEVISVGGKPMIKSLYGKASIDIRQSA